MLIGSFNSLMQRQKIEAEAIVVWKKPVCSNLLDRLADYSFSNSSHNPLKKLWKSLSVA